MRIKTDNSQFLIRFYLYVYFQMNAQTALTLPRNLEKYNKPVFLLKSDQNLTHFLDECVDCSIPGSRCVPCQVKPMFETLDSCFKFCKIPNQSRKLNKRKISINFLYQQKYPQLFAATGITEQVNFHYVINVT